MPSGHPGDPDHVTRLAVASDGSGEAAEAAEAPDLSFLGAPLERDELGRLAHYRVLRLIGAGGMGMVFEAQDTHLLRPVALKVMRPELAASLTNRTRFLKEARAAAAIVSDHVVPVYQVGQDNDVPFMVMPLLQGEPLDVRLKREGRLPVAEAALIAAQAARGLAAAHAAGLVHRDIKPGNLWLDTGPPCRVRILDLGLVRGTEGGPRLTTAGVVVGTPHFMAPEQASGQPVDARADLFSLGCVLYTMLSGEMAFPGESTMAVLMALATRDPPPLSATHPDVPPALSDLCVRLLAKAKEDRPASALEVAEELEAILAAGGVPDVVHPSRASAAQARPAIGSPATAARPIETVAFATPPAIPAAGTSPEAGTPRPPPDGRGGAGGRAISIGTGLAVVALLVAAVVLVFSNRGRPPAPAGPAGEPIVVGVLHSQSGTMAVSEGPVVDATLLAVDEVNEAGGVLGRQIKAVTVDGKSDPDEFARLAERLVAEDNAAAVFGCWTSASRKAVRPVFERHGHLLFYPVQYEGLERSPQIVYLGAAPNQQLLPAIDFLTRRLGKAKLFLVGSDYVFPRTAHEIIRDHVRDQPGVRVVGEAFIPLGSPDVASAIEAIRKAGPDAIVNTINGGTNLHFFRALRAAGLTTDKVRTLSVSIAESEVEGLNPAALAGDYLAAAYFQTVDRPENAAFVRAFRARYGEGRVVSDAMAAAYEGVHLWAAAVKAAGSAEPAEVREALRGRSFDGPRARVVLDGDTQHAWLPVRIGRIRADGQIALVADAGSETPIKPVPFPATRTSVQWQQLLTGLQLEWNGKWQAPGR